MSWSFILDSAWISAKKWVIVEITLKENNTLPTAVVFVKAKPYAH